MNINLVRDKKTGKPKGFCFLCYENQKSTVLAVDNLNGIKVSICQKLVTFICFVTDDTEPGMFCFTTGSMYSCTLIV